jgi:hypothetical protein
MLDVPLALLGRQDIFMSFCVDEPVQPVLLRETVGDIVAMFPGAASEIRGIPT